MTDSIWDGFAEAVVRVSLPDGDARLEPASPGQSGDFPFGGAIYRWTADALTILGVDEDVEVRLGWRLSEITT